MLAGKLDNLVLKASCNVSFFIIFPSYLKSCLRYKCARLSECGLSYKKTSNLGEMSLGSLYPFSRQ